LRRDNLQTLLDAVDYELVLVPTAKAVVAMAQQFGYETRLLQVANAEHPALEKWRYGLFATFLCAKKTDLTATSAFRFRSLASLSKAQARGAQEASWARKGRERHRLWRRK
jgi:hypothetical protein